MAKHRPRMRLNVAEYRGAVWRMVIEMLRAVHRDRFPRGSHFGADAEKLLVYGAAVLLYLEGQSLRTSKIAQYLDLPQTTARRHIAKLIDYGLIVEQDHTLGLAPWIADIPASHVDKINGLVAQVLHYF